MSTPYPDIEGQLYTTGAPDATYTEAEARQRAADRREVAATASAAGASALVSAKTYTDQKVTGLATTVAMNAADALTLSNAKTYTDSKVSPLATVASVVAGDLKALADAKTYTDEQVEGLDLGSGIETVFGTVTLDATGEPIREFYATGTATVQGEALAAGDAAVFRRLNGAWSVMVVGKDTAWRSVGADPTPPVDPSVPAPAAPAGVAASSVTDTTASLSWQASTSPGVTAYRYSLDGGASWTIAASPVALVGLTPSTTYTPQVQAYNGQWSTSATGVFTTEASASVVIADDFAGPDGSLSGRLTPTGAATWMTPWSAPGAGDAPLTITSGKVSGPGAASYLSPVQDTVLLADYDVTVSGSQVRLMARGTASSAGPWVGAFHGTSTTASIKISGLPFTTLLLPSVPSTGQIGMRVEGNQASFVLNGREYGPAWTITEVGDRFGLFVYGGGLVDNFRADPAAQVLPRVTTISETFTGAEGATVATTQTDDGAYTWKAVQSNNILGVAAGSPKFNAAGQAAGAGGALLDIDQTTAKVAVEADYNVSASGSQVRVGAEGGTSGNIVAWVTSGGTLHYQQESTTPVQHATGIPVNGRLVFSVDGATLRLSINGAQVGDTVTINALTGRRVAFGIVGAGTVDDFKVVLA